MTVNGRLEFCRSVFWNEDHGTVVPLDILLGIESSNHSLGVREICCRESLNNAFVPASENIKRLAQLDISSGVVRQIVEHEGSDLSRAMGDLAVLMLEPQSPDSFFQWGFFHEILQRTEYVEAYVMEPMAQRMLTQDPQLREDFQKKLKEDQDFAANPRARLQWFYQKTPFHDDQWRLYPVAREL